MINAETLQGENPYMLVRNSQISSIETLPLVSKDSFISLSTAFLIITIGSFSSSGIVQ